MISLSEFTVTKIKEEGNQAEFEITPLPTGFGNTLGNTLRRTLLASIPGSAITAVKIKGVQHEYSTLPGVSDDVLKVILSLKNVIILGKSEEPVELKLTKKGKKGSVVEVTAGDFEKNSDVEIINADYVITKLTDAVDFELSVTVERNIGYQLPKESVREEVGLLPVDAIFSPVVNVSYEVIPTRVGQQTELDKLTLVVKTNGAITPSDAMNIASNILLELTQNLVNSTKDMISGRALTSLPTTDVDQYEEEVVVKSDNGKSLPISDLNLSTRLTNALLRSGFDDLRKLEGFTEEEVQNIRGMGEKSLVELIDVLKSNGINLI
jgi:DNA-directed RNA polymerase subunit alpha